jgi:hypothetical protein
VKSIIIASNKDVNKRVFGRMISQTKWSSS